MDKNEIIKKENPEKYELEVKKSKFLAFVYYVENKEQIENIIAKNRIMYKDAKHIVYAYMLKNTGGFTDDKEPQGTAGKPIYNLLEKENLINVLVIVIRYFGGILLGTGPLTRAYSTAAKEALGKCEKRKYIEYEKCFIDCDYAEENNIKQELIKINCVITNIQYLERVRICYLKPVEN